MSFLLVDNNLADIAMPYEARLNLGLGSMSIQSSNEVEIYGGSIKANTFQLKPTSNLQSTDYFLKNIDADGTVEWFQIPSLNWLNSNQNTVLVSGFSNDAKYITRGELASVSFSGDFNDLSNLPDNLTRVYSNDILDKFLYGASNLDDIVDKVAARENLGLGSMATQNDSNVSVSNLTIIEDFKFPESIGNGFMFIDGESNISALPSFPIASSSSPGIVYAKDAFDSNESNVDASVPTMNLLSNQIANIVDKIEANKINNVEDVAELIQSNNFLYRSNLLSEFTTDSEKLDAQSNLGLGNICTQDSNHVICGALTVDNLSFSSNASSNLTGKRILTFDNSNNSVFLTMSDFLATSNSPGTIFLTDDHNASNIQNSNFTALSMYAVSNYVQQFETRIEQIKTSIPTDVSQLSGANDYLLLKNNLSDLQDIELAKSNLGLSRVATTGAYADLTDKPFSLSSFCNDIGYLMGECNLSDIPDPIKARDNLGLGSMATQDMYNVKIKGGIVRFKKLEIKNEFFYQDDEDVPNGKILVCADRNGLMEWKDLPKASFNTYGTVQISDHIKFEDQRTDVVPTCKVFSVIEENLKAKLDNAMRAYLLGPEFTNRLSDASQRQVDKILELTNQIEILTAEGVQDDIALSNLLFQSTSNYSYLDFVTSSNISNLEYNIANANTELQSNESNISDLQSNVLHLEDTLELANENYDALSIINILLQARVLWPNLGSTLVPTGLTPGSWRIGSMSHGAACSKDGYTVVMSGMNHEINDRGVSVLFRYNPSTESWSQLAYPIEGDEIQDLAGFSVSMDESGNRFALSSPNGKNGNGIVKIFEYSAESLSFDGISEIEGGDNEQIGTSVSFSADGTRIAVSGMNKSEIFQVSGTQLNGSFPNQITAVSGLVRVYELRQFSCIQVGSDISGNENAAFGWSIDLSDTGKTLVVGSPGQNSYTSVWEENDTSGEWEQIAVPTGFCGDDTEGSRVAITNDGLRIATAAVNADDNAGRVRIFDKLEDGSFSQVATFSSGEAGTRIGGYLALSKDGGHTVAFGNYNWAATDAYDPSYTVYRERDSVWSKYGLRLKTDVDSAALCMSYDGKRVFIGQPVSNNVDGSIIALEDPVPPQPSS